MVDPNSGSADALGFGVEDGERGVLILLAKEPSPRQYPRSTCAFIYDEGDAMRGLDDLRGNSSSQLTAPQFRLRRLEISEMYKYVQKWRNRGVCNSLA